VQTVIILWSSVLICPLHWFSCKTFKLASAVICVLCQLSIDMTLLSYSKYSAWEIHSYSVENRWWISLQLCCDVSCPLLFQLCFLYFQKMSWILSMIVSHWSFVCVSAFPRFLYNLLPTGFSPNMSLPLTPLVYRDKVSSNSWTHGP